MRKRGEKEEEGEEKEGKEGEEGEREEERKEEEGKEGRRRSGKHSRGLADLLGENLSRDCLFLMCFLCHANFWKALSGR